MKKLYSVYDNKSKSYGPIFGVPHDAVAIREFGAAISNEQSGLAKYPDDFELHQVGTFADIEDDWDVNTKTEGVVQSARSDDNGVVVVITARQWFDAQPKKADNQLSLLEANG